MLEQEVKSLVFQMGYAGGRAVRPLVNMNANASPPGTGSAGGILSQRWGKNYTGTINQLIPFKNNYYDSLQTKVTERLPDGSNVGVTWTWSKTIDYEDNEDLSSLSFPYPAYWQKNRALAGFDRTHNVQIWSVMHLPFGPGERWAQSGVSSWILGGWLVDPLISYLSGAPFTVTAGGNLNANGSSQTADRVGQSQGERQAATHWRHVRTG